MSPWLILFVAIAFEVAGATFLKLSEGLRRPLVAVIMLACYGTSLLLMSKATQVLPISITYPIWCGIGIVAIAVVGAFVFGETIGLMQVLYMGLIIAGVVGLRMA